MDNLIRKVLSIFPQCIQNIYDKHYSLFLYLIVGGMTTVISWITQFIPFWLWGTSTVINTTVSWVCSVTFAFITNKVWVFQNTKNSKRDWLYQGLTFYGARVVTYFVELGILVLGIDVLGYNHYLMKLIAQFIIIAMNYVFSKFVIFANGNNKNDT